MTTYNLLKTPNQKFSTSMNGNAVEIRIRTFRGLMYVSISINGKLVESSVRAMPNTDLFGTTVRRTLGGNFMFVCVEKDEYPEYKKLNGTDVVFAFVGENE